MKSRPASARLTTNTGHLMTRAITTLLSTFGTRCARYRPSFRPESWISIRADRFEAGLARIARNATNEKTASAWSRRACSGVGYCTSWVGCKFSTSSCLTSEDLRKRCTFVMLNKGGEVCHAESGLGSGISHTPGKLAALIGGRTTSRMRLYSVSWNLRCFAEVDGFLPGSLVKPRPSFRNR
jgi:hypothetical protein